MNELLQTLQVYRFDRKYRLGANRDGGYVLADLEGGYDCYISAGISNEESFSRDFIDKHGLHEYNSFGFDATVDKYPYEYTNKISFIKKNIGPENTYECTNLSHIIETHRHIFLKMDIEGAEYPWLQSVSSQQLGNFKQIVIELHGIINDGWNCSHSNKIRCLQKLARTHYLVHAHGNNYGPVVDGIPDVIELTYVNKLYFLGKDAPEWNRCPLPIMGIDFPNNDPYPDIPLNFYPFLQ